MRPRPHTTCHCGARSSTKGREATTITTTAPGKQRGISLRVLTRRSPSRRRPKSCRVTSACSSYLTTSHCAWRPARSRRCFEPSRRARPCGRGARPSRQKRPRPPVGSTSCGSKYTIHSLRPTTGSIRRPRKVHGNHPRAQRNTKSKKRRRPRATSLSGSKCTTRVRSPITTQTITPTKRYGKSQRITWSHLRVSAQNFYWRRTFGRPC